MRPNTLHFMSGLYVLIFITCLEGNFFGGIDLQNLDYTLSLKKDRLISINESDSNGAGLYLLDWFKLPIFISMHISGPVFCSLFI